MLIISVYRSFEAKLLLRICTGQTRSLFHLVNVESCKEIAVLSWSMHIQFAPAIHRAKVHALMTRVDHCIYRMALSLASFHMVLVAVDSQIFIWNCGMLFHSFVRLHRIRYRIFQQEHVNKCIYIANDSENSLYRSIWWRFFVFNIRQVNKIHSKEISVLFDSFQYRESRCSPNRILCNAMYRVEICETPSYLLCNGFSIKRSIIE